MDNKGGSGCAILALVGLCAGAGVVTYLVFTQASWLLWAVPALIALLLVVADVFRDDAFLAAEQPTGFTAWHAAMLTRIRRLIGKPAIQLVPQTMISPDERLLVKRATKLAGEVLSALRQSPVPETQRSQVVQQTEDVPANIAKALWRLARLRRIKRSADPKTEQGQQTAGEIAALEQSLLAEMSHSLDVLAAVPMNMVRVELAKDTRHAEQVLADLNESNSKLQDLSEAYRELGGGSGA